MATELLPMSPRRLECEDIGAGMSVCWFDYDNDGAEDLYVADMWTAAGERVSTQDIFKKDSPPESPRAVSQARDGQFACFETTLAIGSRMAARLLRTQRASAGVGNGPLGVVERRVGFRSRRIPDLYIANGMVSGPSRNPRRPEQFFLAAGGGQFARRGNTFARL